MRYRTAILVSLALSSAALSSGCASWFMNGGKLVEDDYTPAVKATYTVPSCKNLADGSAIAGPANTHYKLVQDAEGLGMFEQSADGTGAVITNRWSDDKGDHYFGWVQSTGWEYVIPPSGQATRIVYSGLETKQEGATTKPVSSPFASCDMVPAT